MSFHDALLTALALAVLAAGYRLHVALFPFTACSRCSGSGDRRPPMAGRRRARSFGMCRWCGGSGRKLRLGARLFGGER